MLYILLLFAIILSWWYLYSRFKLLSIIEFILISYTIFFSLYALSDLINGNIKVDGFIFLLTFFYLFIGLIFLILFYRYFFPQKLLYYLSLDSIVNQSKKVSFYSLIFIVLFSFSVIMYYYLQFDFIFRSLRSDNGVMLNQYLLVIKYIVLPLLFFILIISVIRVNDSNISKLVKAFLIGMILLIEIYMLFYGRRELILSILLLIIFHGYINCKNIFSIKFIPKAIFALFIIFIASNIYQNIRFQIMFYSIKKELPTMTEVINSAFDFESSNSNLSKRVSLFKYTSDLMEKYTYRHDSMQGNLLINNINNTLPSVLIGKKTYINDDEAIAKHFGFFVRDYPTSLASSVLADTGYLAVLIFPIFMILYIMAFVFLLRWHRNNPIIYSLLFTYLLYIVFNVETSVGGMFVVYRNVFIIALLFGIIEIFSKNKVKERFI